MKVETTVSAFVRRLGMVVPIATLKKAKDESDEYEWMRVSEGHYACAHDGTTHIVIVDHDRIGCSCGAMTFHCRDNDVCKHITAFDRLAEPPQKPVGKEIVTELINAGWVGGKNHLKMPGKATPGPGTEDGSEQKPAPELNPGTEINETDTGPQPLGTKIHTRTCPNCSRLFEGADPNDVVRRHREHVQTCPKNPANKDVQKKHPDNDKPTEQEANMKEKEKVIELNDSAKRVITEAEELGAKDIDSKYVVDKLLQLERFRVPKSEAERSVVSAILRSQGIKRLRGEGMSNVLVSIATIDTSGRWINLRAKVVDLWDNNHESIRQVGLIGDESGTIKFVSWEKADLPNLEVDKCYMIENVVTNEYKDMFSVAFTKNTRIAEIDYDIDVGFAGIMVSIRNGSGLIKRCPKCNRAIVKGACKEHGNVDGAYDLRIKAVLDDGVTTRNVLLNRERTEELTGITLDEARAMAVEALDADVVASRMQDMLIGREFAVSGRYVGDAILAESVSRIDAPITKDEIKALLEAI